MMFGFKSWRRCILRVLGLAAGTMILSGAAGATLLQVNPTDDRSAAASAGFGSVFVTDELIVEVLRGPGLPTGHVLNRSAMEFDISSIPVGATINSATLALDEISPLSPGVGVPVMEVRGYSGDGTVVMSDLLGSGVLSSVPGDLINGSLTSPFGSIGVTSFVQSLFAGGGGFAGFLLRIAGDDVNAGVSRTLRFSSTDVTSASKRPLLTVDYTPSTGGIAIPEPTSLALFALGLAGLGFMGWRRAKV